MSVELARTVLDQIYRLGVRELCVCPGARNAEWVRLLAESDQFKVYWSFEERSASFFALGRIRTTERPVAVVTTSGTAVGELLPATMEAWYSGLPLLLLTADRPRRFRGSGAPQAAEQVEIFGPYVARSLDIADGDLVELEEGPLPAPIHLNVCFEDPKGVAALPNESKQTFENLSEFLEVSSHPLVIVGQLLVDERSVVEQFLQRLGAPAYLETLSGLRERDSLTRVQLKVGDRLFARLERSGFPVDGVIRIGGVPTHRMWRDLEDRASHVPVVSVSRLPFSGLGRASTLLTGEIQELLSIPLGAGGQWSENLAENDHAVHCALLQALDEEPVSEPGIFHRLSKDIEKGSLVFLGNSLPVREWDLAATWEDRGFEMAASRGLNGIDGQVSTFLGMCRRETPNWAILGDLTALYDLAGPWLAGQMDPAIQATIVVINNAGGKIFDRMFPNREFQNEHERSFEAWSNLWGLPYSRNVAPSAPGLRIIELQPDQEATRRFWARYEACLK
jgi:2-succinyl-5-enolpyruvyl-6-hydroxy-3-cyclohexene-1-carboxylate synthase